MEKLMVPVEYKVLIKPDPAEQVTQGGIIIPDTLRDRNQIAQDRGVLVEVGGNAFEDFKGVQPEIGDVVLFSKYAGYTLRQNREEYRVCNDKDVTMVLLDSEEKAERELQAAQEEDHRRQNGN